jgi:hypothetical protein
VTFSSPVAGWVSLYLYDCVGDYSKAPLDKDNGDGQHYVLFPNADRTVFTGSAYFGCCYEDGYLDGPCDVGCTDCCATIVEVGVGKCEECYYDDAFIVDCAGPEVDLGLRFVDCGDPCDPCDITAGVYMEFTSLLEESVCDDPTDCCDDDCSGIASWTMTIDPDVCAEPCDIISGESCPVEGISDCCFAYADSGEVVCYDITFEIVDKVGNVTEAEWEVCLDTDEVVSFSGYGGPVDWDEEDLETDWMGVAINGCCMP